MVKTTDNVIDKYIERFPKEMQLLLREVKSTIKSVAPETTEGISYGIPTFYLNKKYLVYFAGFKSHISVYPATTAAVDNVKGLSAYKVSKGTLQFPIDKPIPYDLIKEFVKLRMEEEKTRLEKGGDK